MRALTRWGLLWQSRCHLDGETRHIMGDGRNPYMFVTRAEARKFRDERYGYIKSRPDLRAEPHGWLVPKPVRLNFDLKDSALKGRAGT